MNNGLRFQVFVLFFMFIFSGLTLAQEEIPIKPADGQPVRQKQDISEELTSACIDSFNIESVDYKESVAMKNLDLLVGYFQCQAAVKDSISECSRLNLLPDRAETCRQYFNQYQHYFGKIFTYRMMTPDTVSSCMQSLEADEKSCSNLTDFIIRDDVNGCNQLDTRYSRDCKAFVSGNAQWCSSESCTLKANYIAAVKLKSLSACANIKDALAQSSCKGTVSQDLKICENDEGFKLFRDKYCTAKSKIFPDKTER